MRAVLITVKDKDGQFIEVPDTINPTIDRYYANDGSLNFGIMDFGQLVHNYWTCFDNFTLRYYGNMPTVDHTQYGHDGNTDNTGNAGGTLTGINSVTTSPASKSIYTITGQKLNNNATLQKGLYIINGKKVIVK
jgi:hypothetical protein